MDWADLHSELKNKIRWAIGSSAAENGVGNLPYRDQKTWAGLLADQVVAGLKNMEEKPDFRPWLTKTHN